MFYVYNIQKISHIYNYISEYQCVKIIFFKKKVALNSLNANIKNKLLSFFRPSDIEQLARKSLFIRRKSKLNAFNFLITIMFSRFEGSKLSLNDISNELFDKFRCNITKQSIHVRFNEKCVNFFKSVISESFKKNIYPKNNIVFFKHFSAVKIQDSTCFQIPESLSEYYKGSGGSASGAQARVQFEYDLKNMQMTTLELTSGTYQDTSYSQDNVNNIKEGELVIRDLGYVSFEYLKQITKQDAFFVNRLHSKQTVYIEDTKGKLVMLDFKSLLHKINKRNIKSKELDILIKKNDEFLKMRLIIEKMPDEIYEKRIRAAVKKAKKNKHKLSEEHKARIRFNLFITNVNPTVLKLNEIGYLYSLRWQIELIFKSWKSTFNIASVKEMKKERFECQLYARLLLIIICWDLYSEINKEIVITYNLSTPSILSYFKFSKTICHRLESFMLASIHKGMNLHIFISSLILTSILKKQEIEPKNKTLSSIHIFERITYLAHIERFRYISAA